jgi:hypothetical protein
MQNSRESLLFNHFKSFQNPTETLLTSAGENVPSHVPLICLGELAAQNYPQETLQPSLMLPLTRYNTGFFMRAYLPCSLLLYYD